MNAYDRWQTSCIAPRSMSRTQISIRLDSDVLDFLERNAARMREHVPGARITRADAARLLLEEARRSAGEPK